jgi:hypothetical protein
VVDVDAVLNQFVGDSFIGDGDLWLGVVAGAEDRPVKGGSAVLVGGLDVSAVRDELLRFGEAIEEGLLFGLAGSLVQLLDEWRGVRDVEGYGCGCKLVVGDVWRVIGCFVESVRLSGSLLLGFWGNAGLV